MSRPKRVSTQTTKRFADRLGCLIEEKKKEGVRQKDIANALGVGSGTLSEWCSDNKTATIEYLPRIAAYFSVSVEWLIGCSDVRKREISIQAIHEEIGLTENAIELLKKWNNSQPEKIKLLCKLICSLGSQEKHCITSEQGTVARSLIDSMDAEQWRTLFKLYLEVMPPETQLDDK